MKFLKVEYLLSLIFFLLFNAICDANNVFVDRKYGDANGNGKDNLQICLLTTYMYRKSSISAVSFLCCYLIATQNLIEITKLT